MKTKNKNFPMKDELLFSISKEEIQIDAEQRIGRRLTDEELYNFKKGLEWGLLTGIDTIYSACYEISLEKR